MLPQHKRNVNIGVGVGLLLSFIANFGMPDTGLGFLVALVGTGFFIWGCSEYARAKGYSPWWGALGFLSILGLIALVFFPDRHKHATA